MIASCLCDKLKNGYALIGIFFVKLNTPRMIVLFQEHPFCLDATDVIAVTSTDPIYSNI